jgi:hypothetical protein
VTKVRAGHKKRPQSKFPEAAKTHRVPDVARVVTDAKEGLACFGHEKVLVALVLVGDLLPEAVVRAAGKVGLVVQHVKDTKRPLGDEVQARLVVVKLHLGPVNALAVVHILLQLEDVLVEVELQLLVGVVNAQLLKAVDFEVLKAEDVEDANGVDLELWPKRT